MPKYQAAGVRRPYEITLLVVAVAAAGLNLRTAITSLPPLFPDLQAQLHLSPAGLSLLAATPVICFGVVSAFAAWLNRLVRRGSDPAGGAGPAHRGPAAARRGARGHAVPRHGAGGERDRRPQRAALQHGQAALAGTGRAAHRHLPDRAVGGRDPVLAAQRAGLPQFGWFGAAGARPVGGPRRAGRAAVAAPAQVPHGRPQLHDLPAGTDLQLAPICQPAPRPRRPA